MKKILAVLLAMVLAFGCTAIAFADTPREIKCGWCGSTFDTDTALEKHQKDCPNKNKTTECPFCKQQIGNDVYSAHVAACEKKHQSDDGVSPYLTCPYCGNKFADEEQYNKHLEVCKGNAASDARLVCPYCNNVFTSEEQYNAHIQTCYGQAHWEYNDAPNGANFFNLSASQILDKLVELFDMNANWWDGIEDIIIRLVDFIENIGLFASAEGDVAGAVDDLDAKVESLGIVGDVYNYIKNLINTLKQKIKDFYAGNRETEPVEETTGAEPVATGSSSIGFAAFAAVSVAAAAAYVCVKKKEN